MAKIAKPSQLWPDLIHPYSTVLKPMPIPDAAPCDEPCECLFINAEWRGYLVGALEILAQPDTWQGTDEQKEAAILNVDEIIACLLGGDMSCTEELTNRLDALIQCCYAQKMGSQAETFNVREVLQDRYTGDPWDIDVDVPHTNWTETTGDSEAKIVEREVALCKTINRYLKTLANELKLANVLMEGIGTAGVGMISLINPILGVAGWIAMGIASGMSEFVWDDEEALKKNACCMYDNLLGETTVDFDTFKTSAQGCGFGPVTTEEWQRIAYDGCNHDEDNYLAFLDALGEETRAAGLYGGDTSECDCADDWEITYNFLEGELDWFGTPNPILPEGPAAVWQTAYGWNTVDAHHTDHDFQRVCWPQIDFSQDAVVTSVQIYYDCERGTFDGADPYSSRFRLYNNDAMQADVYEPIIEGTGKILDWSGSETFDQVRLYFKSSYRATTEEWTGAIRIYKIVLAGSGEPPEV